MSDANLHPAPHMPEPLSILTIYDHPKDHPNHFVVRRWNIYPGRSEPVGEVHLFDTLEAARTMVVAQHRTLLHRHPDDDPVIVENWI
jgi:hypothetical protein